MSDTMRYRCCEHCAEDPIHDVETDHHEARCPTPGCKWGRTMAGVKP